MAVTSIFKLVKGTSKPPSQVDLKIGKPHSLDLLVYLELFGLGQSAIGSCNTVVLFGLTASDNHSYESSKHKSLFHSLLEKN